MFAPACTSPIFTWARIEPVTLPIDAVTSPILPRASTVDVISPLVAVTDATFPPAKIAPLTSWSARTASMSCAEVSVADMLPLWTVTEPIDPAAVVTLPEKSPPLTRLTWIWPMSNLAVNVPVTPPSNSIDPMEPI